MSIPLPLHRRLDLPPTIDDSTCAPVFTSIIIEYTVFNEVGIHNAYVELASANSRLLLNLKEAVDLPTGVLEFTNLNPGKNYIVKFTAVDTDCNTTFVKNTSSSKTSPTRL
jgi:hypothetical protein